MGISLLYGIIERVFMLSDKMANRIAAGIQLFLCGVIAAMSFRREIKVASKVTNKMKKRRIKREAKALKQQQKLMAKAAKKGGIV